jgi:hypothetical protein
VSAWLRASLTAWTRVSASARAPLDRLLRLCAANALFGLRDSGGFTRFGLLHYSVALRAGFRDGLVGLRLCLVDASLRFGADPLGFCWVCCRGTGQSAVGVAPGPERFQLRRYRLGWLGGPGALIGLRCGRRRSRTRLRSGRRA